MEFAVFVIMLFRFAGVREGLSHTGLVLCVRIEMGW